MSMHGVYGCICDSVDSFAYTCLTLDTRVRFLTSPSPPGSCIRVYLESGRFFNDVGSRARDDRLGMNVGGELGQGAQISSLGLGVSACGSSDM